MLIGVRTSEPRFHYTLGMDRTAVWAIALDLRFRDACDADSFIFYFLRTSRGEAPRSVRYYDMAR